MLSPESSMDLSVLERLKWVQQQQQQQQIHMVQENDSAEIFSMLNVSSGRELKRLETYLGNNNLLNFGNFNEFGGIYDMGFVSAHDSMDGCISRTNSCQTEAMDVSLIIKEEETEKLALKKRKSKLEEEEGREKKIKREIEASESIMKVKRNDKIRSAEMSSDTSKENSKVSEIQKQDFIHVRARRGQATDRHSIAERARREKISKKMKYLQELVPGCNKITGKAGMLDEIINYVQSLQRQVEFLSMKLAVMNPAIESQKHLQASSAWDVQMESLYNLYNLGFEDLNRA